MAGAVHDSDVCVTATTGQSHHDTFTETSPTVDPNPVPVTVIVLPPSKDVVLPDTIDTSASTTTDDAVGATSPSPDAPDTDMSNTPADLELGTVQVAAVALDVAHAHPATLIWTPGRSRLVPTMDNTSPGRAG